MKHRLHLTSLLLSALCMLFLILQPFVTSSAIECQASASSVKAVITDDADILTDSEEKTLFDFCSNVYDKYNTALFIWTDNEIGKSDNYDAMMEDFVAKYNNGNIVILLVGMKSGDRVYEIQGYGTAMDFMNNERCNKVMDAMYDDLHDGNYYASIHTFCTKTSSFLEKNPKFDSIMFSPLAQAGASLLIAVIVIGIFVMGSKGRMTAGARNYIDLSHSSVIGSFDRYTHTTVVRRQKPKDDDSGSSSGSSHSSGGGRSF